MYKFHMGIDTSCYTSSIAVVNELGDIVFRKEIILSVKNNTCGLRQSDAYYQHTYNIPNIIAEMSGEVDTSQIESIGISVKPRPYIESYMPVFMAGYNSGSMIASFLNRPISLYTHQDGHFFSSIIDENIDDLCDCNNLCVHLSGGTTEFIKYKIENNKVSSEILLSTLDISFGQLIDRIGVYSGLKFPCGRKMDELASLYNEKITPFFKPKIKDQGINVSGLENKFKRMIDEETDKNKIFKILFENISYGIKEIVDYLFNQDDYSNIVFVGGVSSNSILKKIFSNNSFGETKIKFACNENLRDNAVGIAYMNCLGVEYCDTRWQKDFEENNSRNKR